MRSHTLVVSVCLILGCGGLLRVPGGEGEDDPLPPRPTVGLPQPAVDPEPAVDPDPAPRPGPRSPRPTPPSPLVDAPPVPQAETPDDAPPVAPVPEGVPVELSGDARVSLVSSTVRHLLPGVVPVGRYAIEVQFGDAAPFEAGKVTVIAGHELSVVCLESLGTCRAW